MKTEFKAKFLQHVAKKRKEEGFTLIELLVVIIIIGILSAIALPSFLNQANKAKQSEAKQYTSSLNKGQQAYYVENTEFVTDGKISKLGLGIQTQTTNYKYTIGSDANGASSLATPANGSLLGYAGAVGLVGTKGAQTTATIICQQSVAANTAPSAPTISGTTEPTCAASQTLVTK